MDNWAREYKKIKESYPDEILLYQVGIFYKIIFSDAQRVADTLGLKLFVTGEVTNPAPICGFPKSGLDKYVGKLVRGGFAVAICPQTKDEAGKIKREVCEVIKCRIEK